MLLSRKRSNSTTTTTTTAAVTQPTASSAPPPPPPQVRHAGRAHVRGKFRRVWRSRYLELLDQGIVRYYEFPSSKNGSGGGSSSSYSSCYPVGTIGSSMEDSWQFMMGESTTTTSSPPISEWIPKYTLQISHARILDVTTLRDMHVGLPRGSFGFTFRGQRLRHLEQSHQQQSVHQDNAEFTADPEPRDFLCAVDTLEDAQMWVVALQWAASERMVVESVSEFVTPSTQQQQQQQFTPQKSRTVETTGDYVTVTAPPTTATSVLTTPQGSSVAPVMAVAPTSTNTTTTGTTSLRKGGTGGGRMVVTKVTTVRIVRISMWQWEIAYEIHGLLVSGGGSPPSLDGRAEWWMALRTARDLWHLLQALYHEVRSSDLLVWKQPLLDLPRLENRQEYSLSHSSFQQTLLQSIPIVDGMLRSLVTDATMVKTNALKTFLGLTTTTTTTNLRQPNTLAGRLWDIHNGQAIMERRVKPLPEQSTQPLEVYVRQWLQTTTATSTSATATIPSSIPPMPQRSSSGITTTRTTRESLSAWDSYAAFCLQRPLTFLGGVGVSSVAALWPLCKWAWTVCDVWIPSFWIRADALVITWIGAAYLGYQYHHCYVVLPTSTTTTGNRQKQVETATNRTYPVGSSPNNKTRLVQRPNATDKATATIDKQQEIRKAAKVDDDEEDDEGTEVIPAAGDDDHDTNNDDDDGVIAKDNDDESSDGEMAPMAITEATGVSGMAVGDDLFNTTIMNNKNDGRLSSPLPKYPDNNGKTCWSQPIHNIFHVRSVTYLKDRVKEPSGPAPLKCRGVDVWMTDNPERHIARHPAVVGGKLNDEDTFLVNFLLPFGNFVAYFSVPPLDEFPQKLQTVWTKFLHGDQQYRDARLKLLPVVAEGPWIVKAAVGPGKSPALLGKVIPLQYFFRHPSTTTATNSSNDSNNGDGASQEQQQQQRGVYEVDVIITASSIAKGILSVVKGHTKSVSLAFAFIIEAAEQEELPETVLCSCQVHSLYLEHCPILPPYNLDGDEQEE